MRAALVLLAAALCSLPYSPARGQSSGDAKCVKFGNSFDVSLESTNVELACRGKLAALASPLVRS